MAFFPLSRTPLPAQRNIHVCIAGIFTISVLLIFCIYGFSRDKNNCSPKKNEYYIKAEKEGNWIEKVVGDPVALFTLVLTGFTGGLYLATRALWSSTERLVRGAETTAISQLRAYVLTDGAHIENIENPEARIISFTSRNFGQTPATQVKTLVATAIRPFPLDRELEKFDEKDISIGTNTLPPSGPAEVSIKLDKTTTFEENELRNGRAAIYIYGFITYVDAFRTHRKTNFRLMCCRDGLAQGRVSPCTGGNDYT